MFCQADTTTDEDHPHLLTVYLMASCLSQNFGGAALLFALCASLREMVDGWVSDQEPKSAA